MIDLVPALRDDRSGVALVEFALSLPLLLLLGLGGLDTVRYVQATMRCAEIAQTVADNAGRVRHALDETDVNEVMIGGKLMGQSIQFKDHGRIILSDLEQRTNTSGTGGQGTKTTINPNGYRQWIRWQRCAGGLASTDTFNGKSSYGGPLSSTGAAITDLNGAGTDHGAVQDASRIDGMGPANHQIVATPATAVMVVEIFYKFDPVSSYFPFGANTIHIVQAFNIRERTDFSVYNAKSLAGNDRSDCRLYNSTIPDGGTV